METKTQIQKAGGAVATTNSPAEMIRLAVSGGADLDKLEKLLGLQERWDAMEAKKAYNQAMADFKASPPQIYKDKHVGFTTQKGKTEYNHATLANVCEKINKAMSPHGLSASWVTKQADNGKISVTCKITHARGHSEETMLTANPDDTGSKNSIQAIGSTVSYLQRYTILALTGLATEEQDDDAQTTSPIDLIRDQELIILRDYIVATETDEKKFLGYMGIESLEKMPLTHYQKALTALKEKAKGKKGGAK